MIKTYPIVTDEGLDTGGSVSFKWKYVVGIQQLSKYTHRRNDDGNYVDDIELVPSCCTIFVFGRHEFNVRADYNELVNELEELDESRMYE